MKISKEVKIGAIAIVAVITVIVGLNYLKGNRLFSKRQEFSVKFERSNGLSVGNVVKINDYVVGKVNSVELMLTETPPVAVLFSVDTEFDIPSDSRVELESDLLGDTWLNIEIGQSSTLAQSGDRLTSQLNAGITDQLQGAIEPVQQKFLELMTSVDSVIGIINKTFDEGFDDNIEAYLTDMRSTFENLKNATGDAASLVKKESNKIDNVLTSLDSIAYTINKNRGNIDNMFQNFSSISDSLNDVDLKGTFNTLDSTITQLNTFISKANSGETTLGALVNDRSLYDNLNKSSSDLDSLINDIKNNPRRYVPPLIRIGGKN